VGDDSQKEAVTNLGKKGNGLGHHNLNRNDFEKIHEIPDEQGINTCKKERKGGNRSPGRTLAPKERRSPVQTILKKMRAKRKKNQKKRSTLTNQWRPILNPERRGKRKIWGMAER